MRKQIGKSIGRKYPLATLFALCWEAEYKSTKVWRVQPGPVVARHVHWFCGVGRFGSRSSIFEVTVCAWNRAQLSHNANLSLHDYGHDYVRYKFL